LYPTSGKEAPNLMNSLDQATLSQSAQKRERREKQRKEKEKKIKVGLRKGPENKPSPSVVTGIRLLKN
jgi:hypothetical protein